jgi:hypothetical protein
MSPIPYDPTVDSFIGFIVSISLITSALFLSLLKRYIRRKQSVLLYMTLTLFCWTTGTISYSIGLLSWKILDDRTWIYQLSLPVGYSSLAISAYFVMLFANEFLHLRYKRVVISLSLIYSLTITLLLGFPQNNWGILPPIPVFRMGVLIGLITGNIVIYSYLIYNFRIIVRRLEEFGDRAAMKFILYFFSCMLTTFILMVVNEVVLMFTDSPPTFGAIEYVAWGLGLIGLFLGYVSLFRPKWFNSLTRRQEQKPIKISRMIHD